MSTATRPFTAATNKFAYAQAFTSPSHERPARRPGLLHRVPLRKLGKSARV